MSAFRFSTAPLDTAALQREMRDESCGGFAAFEGWVRNHNEGHAVTRLEYEAFVELAEKEGARIVEEARQKFGVTRAACVHRVGSLALGDVAVWVGVSAAHSAGDPPNPGSAGTNVGSVSPSGSSRTIPGRATPLTQVNRPVTNIRSSDSTRRAFTGLIAMVPNSVRKLKSPDPSGRSRTT